MRCKSLGIAASLVSTLKALELFADIVKMTECCKSPVFKFIIMPKPLQIENFTVYNLSACHMSKNLSMRWGGRTPYIYSLVMHIWDVM